jgi:hypothetical protein
MLHQEIRVPKLLHELHGERTRISTLILVYATAVLAAGLIVSQLRPLGLPAWKLAVAGLIYLDVAGGVVANLSSSTNQYYQNKVATRLVFLGLHILQPAVLAFLFPPGIPYLGFAVAFTLIAAFVMNLVLDVEAQQNLAAALFVVGVVVSLSYDLPARILYTFAPLYMAKLLLGFSVQRPSFLEDEGRTTNDGQA